MNTPTWKTSSLKDNRDGTGTLMTAIHYSDRTVERATLSGLYNEMARAEKLFHGRRRPSRMPVEASGFGAAQKILES